MAQSPSNNVTPSGNARSAENLDTLPAEVLDIISDECGLSLRDNMNIRLVSKAIHASTWEWFRRNTVGIPRGSNSTPNTLHVQMTPCGLDSFTLWTIHPRNIEQIKTVHINVAQFNSDALEKIRVDYDNLLRYDEITVPRVSFRPAFVGMLRRKPSNFFKRTAAILTRSRGGTVGSLSAMHIDGSTRDLVQLRYLKYQVELAEQARMKAAGEDSELSNGAFDRLERLEELVLGSWSIPLLHDDRKMTEWVTDRDHPYAWYFRDDSLPAHRRLLSSYIPQLPHAKGYGRKIRTEVLERVFNLLANKPKELQSLIVQNNSASLDPDHAFAQPTDEEAGIWAFCLPQSTFENLKPSLAHLRKIHLTLSSGEYTPDGTEKSTDVWLAGYTADQGAKSLAQFLSAMPMLDSFQLAAAWETIFTDDSISTVLDALPPTVTKIHLYDFVASVSTLCSFLSKHCDSLLGIGLSRAYLVDESWTPVFQTMQGLTALERISFEALWELRPEFPEKVFFDPAWETRDDVFGERVYYTVSHLGMPAGNFDQMGCWMPCHRYDSLVCGGHDDLSVEEGLRGAMAAERETWPYERLRNRIVRHVCEVFGKPKGDFKVPQPSVIV